MQAFEFSLKFSFANRDIDPEEYVQRLGEEGCDDAIIGIGQKGRIALEFIRSADSALDAVMLAIKQIKMVIPDAKLIEAAPDLVGLSDIAKIVGSTRQNMRKLMINHNHSFPDPMHVGNPSIWHLSHILKWIEQEQNKNIECGIKEIAWVNMQINIAKENVQLDHSYQNQLLSVGL